MKESNRDIRVKKARKLGDPALFYGANNSPVWKLLLTNFGKALLLLFRQFIRANSAIMAYTLTAVKGGNHGVLVCGIGVTIAGFITMSVYNSSYVWSFFSSLMSFSLPELPSWKGLEWHDIAYDLLFVRIQSLPLLIYNAVFVLSSIFHTLKNWFGYGTHEISKRGTSYLYLLCKRLFSKWVAVGEFFINFLETLLIIVLGAALIYYQWDVYFGWFLVSIAYNELIVLITDKTAQLHHKPLLEI
ncbi:MAG: hypothetical protein ABJF04_16235 [Reichenbachiella sp.]|uniref:hypothetical protein n=1 Tax=Reichenbachiella sp. TaxID=2184521 RepID=UPI00326515C0